ncbi:MAG TPA: hypothetical protein VIK18_26860 [Pirellulales bacterium]
MTRSLGFARWCCAVLAGWGLLISSAAAQQPMPKPVLGFKGKFAQALPNGIAVTDPTKNNAIALVQITPNTKLTVEGKADVGYLASGVEVEFSGEMTRLGKMEGELDKITVSDDPLVFEPDDVTQKLPKDKNAVVKMHVRGTVRSFKNGMLMVQSPGATIKVKLVAAPTIKVLVHNYTWAQPGDPVLVDGQESMAAQADQPQQILGTVVKITLEKMLEGKKKGLPARKRPGKS